MTTATVEARRLERAERRVAILEEMIEDRTRALFLSNERLQRANAYLMELYSVMPEALCVVQHDGVVRDVNDALVELIGRERETLLGRTVETISPRLSEFLRSAGDDARVDHFEDEWQSAQGTIPVLLSIATAKHKLGAPIYVIAAADMRERRQLEMELRHAQKLESVGQLAAGIAHEINTPMQFIGDNARFLRDSFDDLLSALAAYRELLERTELSEADRTRMQEAEDDVDLEYLQARVPKAFARTLEGVDRVSTIVSAMKAFAHPGHERVPTDLNQAIQTTLTVARNEVKYVADVVTELGELPLVPCYAGDINQVFLNLVVNAAQAIEEHNEGTDARGLLTIRSQVDGECVVISFTDTGGGIPESIHHRLFEPFFTTKPVGKGTGQGLAISYAVVVEKHGGSLRFETTPGEGTTFVVRLPIQGRVGGPR
ncbi:MAG: ATP-binding protein [Gemmatimonadota bacterium]